MPICHLLEGVAGAQNQRLFHVPSDNLEPNRKAIGGLAAGQCQRWMPAHIKRRGEADACLNCGRSTASDVSQGWRSAVHGWDDEQVDIAEEGIELATKRLPAMPDLGHRKAIEGSAGFQKSGEHRTVFGAARWIGGLMRDCRLYTAERQCVRHNGIGRGTPDVVQQGPVPRQHRCCLFSRVYHVGIRASRDQRAIEADA